MEDINLFGEVQKYYENAIFNPYQRLKQQMHYRKANVLKGEMYCKYCKHCLKMDYHNKIYYKCELIGVSNSEATDIRVKNTCDMFNKKELENESTNKPG